MPRVPNVVVIKKSEKGTGGDGCPKVASRRLTAIFLLQHSFWEGRANRLGERARSVRWSVVHDDQLVGLEGLAYRAADRVAQERGSIEDRYDHRNQGHGHKTVVLRMTAQQPIT